MEIKPYYKYELANKYGVSKPTLMKWVYEKIGETRLFELGGYKMKQKHFSIQQVEEIILKLGNPCKK